MHGRRSNRKPAKAPAVDWMLLWEMQLDEHIETLQRRFNRTRPAR